MFHSLYLIVSFHVIYLDLWYATEELRSSASSLNINIIERFQSKKMLYSLYKINVIPCDPKISSVKEEIKKFSESYKKIFEVQSRQQASVTTELSVSLLKT